MNSSRSKGFVQGMTTGALGALIGSLVLLYALDLSGAMSVGQLPSAARVVGWAFENLGWSIPVFALVLALFVSSLRELKERLREERPVDEIAQADQLTDTWTGLFFGIGVIWTAIGMRSALLYALGDPEATLEHGAFAVLQRMVDGGILLALSTTIFGGIGGYLLRVVKTVTVGGLLKRYYERASRQQAVEIQATLDAIEQQLRALVEDTSQSREVS